jgi:hypothetical protein
MDYILNPLTNSGSYSETYTLQAFAVVPTPEPSTSALLCMGLVVLGLHSRRAVVGKG